MRKRAGGAEPATNPIRCGNGQDEQDLQEGTSFKLAQQGFHPVHPANPVGRTLNHGFIAPLRYPRGTFENSHRFNGEYPNWRSKRLLECKRIRHRLDPLDFPDNRFAEKKWLQPRKHLPHYAGDYLMTAATLNPPPVASDLRSSSEENRPPLARPRKGAWKLLGEVLRHGGPGYLQFAITNICNARCDFCNFSVDRFDPKQRQSVTLAEACDAIDIAARNHIGYLLFVGGEPLVHRDLRTMVRHTAATGIHPMICTNGSLWTEQNMRELVSDGLSSVIMSIDAHDVSKHESNRGLPEVCRKIRRANEVFAEFGVQTTASVTASKLIDDYDRLPAFLTELGFASCTFSYPLTSLASSYLSFSDSKLVSYRTDELTEVFEKIKRMKRRSGFPVVNPSESLSEMQRHLRGEPEKFGCLGGHKYFYLDWNLDLYRCHYWESPMCKVQDWDDSKLIRDGCTRCMIDCYRDPSVLQFAAISLSDAWNNLKRGRPIAAARNVFDTRNLTSLRAVWEDRQWIRKV
jgi:MoaA/NifB/PqqE/SkfB family radical SAM enzyme